MKAIFRYPGSKWNLAPWIVSHFPENYTKYVYLEPFGGSLAVFFNKEPGAIEVVNDLDGDVINLFRVLRERPEELKRAIELTPYSREEYDLAFEPCEDPVERARRFMIIANQGIGAKRRTKSGWQCYASLQDADGTKQISSAHMENGGKTMELKCPWQTITKEVMKNGNKTTITEFAKCVTSACPYWEARNYTAGHLECTCGRVVRG